MTDEQLAGSFSRALARPVRAMSRMLGPAAPTAATVEPPSTVSSIVDCALYIDGVRQPGEWHYAEALDGGPQAPARVRLGRAEGAGRGARSPTIAETFQLHELAVEDAVNSSQRPKVERYSDMTFVTMRTARYVEHDELTESSEVVETGDVLMFIGEHFIITVRHGDACALGPVRADLERKPGAAGARARGRSPTRSRHGRRHRMVEVVAAIEEDIARSRTGVRPQGRSGTDRIQRIYQLKRELMEFKRAVLPLQRPLAALVERPAAPVPPRRSAATSETSTTTWSAPSSRCSTSTTCSTR